eukprot:673388-Prymnesium_polylepis.1
MPAATDASLTHAVTIAVMSGGQFSESAKSPSRASAGGTRKNRTDERRASGTGAPRIGQTAVS